MLVRGATQFAGMIRPGWQKKKKEIVLTSTHWIRKEVWITKRPAYSPTIRCPSSVLKRTICIFMLLPLTEAKTPSTLVHTLRTEPHRT